MKKLPFLLSLILCLVSTAVLSKTKLSSFQIFNAENIFMDEERTLLFTVTIEQAPSEPLEQINLIELDRTEKKVRSRWEMRDDGQLGDQKAGDGIFSRIVNFKEKKPGTVPYYVLEEKRGSFTDLPQELDGSQISSEQKRLLNVKPRPSFIELMGQVIDKIF